MYEIRVSKDGGANFSNHRSYVPPKTAKKTLEDERKRNPGCKFLILPMKGI